MSDGTASRLPAPSGFDAHYGLELVSASRTEVAGRVTLGPQHLQPAGFAHGGLLSAIAESLASWGTHLAVSAGGADAFGQVNETSFLRPVAPGRVDGRARCRHAGRTTWLWDVDLTDAEGRLCAVSRVTVAVRPRRANDAD